MGKPMIVCVSGLSETFNSQQAKAHLDVIIKSNCLPSEGTLRYTIAIVPSCYLNSLGWVAIVDLPEGPPDFLKSVHNEPFTSTSSSSNQRSLTFDAAFTGFTQLYQTADGETITADIIAITGLADLPRTHRYLTNGCLEVLLAELKFNICNLDTSYLFNSEVDGLERTIRDTIGSDLSYYSLYWSSHLAEIRNVDSWSRTLLLDRIKRLFSGHLLHWFEVLRPINAASVASERLLTCARWSNNVANNEPLESLSIDASKFTTRFYPIFQNSVPHIYLSALPFSLENSSVRTQWSKKLHNLVNSTRGEDKDWPRLKILARGHKGWVLSVAFSPDGKKIVSGSHDNTIRVWNSETSASVMDPIQGHESSVLSVAFSPDGKKIVSGSHDNTIRVWDSETGASVMDPIHRHEDSVLSVAFSADGKKIVSGSDDYTIRVWDSETGASVMDPIQGHEGSVLSVAFSPNGKKIVSGSEDMTIQIWDSKTGASVMDPIQSHEDWVRSVAFSSDGKKIVSGSYDYTIRVWDSETGASMMDPIHGHEDSVLSVTFSLDGKKIVSGSDDYTIRVWDSETGASVMDPIHGHEDSVWSVALSPDGTKIVSGSSDATIRVWDSEWPWESRAKYLSSTASGNSSMTVL